VEEVEEVEREGQEEERILEVGLIVNAKL